MDDIIFSINFTNRIIYLLKSFPELLMSAKNRNTKQKSTPPIGKQSVRQIEKAPDFYTKHKSTLWTMIVLIALTIIFIINNTREVPEQGPYPPNYLKGYSENGTSE